MQLRKLFGIVLERGIYSLTKYNPIKYENFKT